MMKNKIAFNVIAGFVFFALLPAAIARAQAAQNDEYSGTTAESAEATSVAAEMVPAQAVLAENLDARKLQEGQRFEATLTGKVRLKNGPELPRGTVLLGTIVTDNRSADGTSTVAVRFTDARLKDGKSIPIIATIIGVAPPEDGFTLDYADQDTVPMPWDGKVLEVDDVGAVSHVELHSMVAGENSGVFESTNEHDIRLRARSRISLAIATQQAVGMKRGF